MNRIFASTLTRIAMITMSVGLCLSAQAAEPSAAMKPEPGAFKMGTQPWLGYGQWQVAEKKGIFKKNGLDKVEIVNFNEDKDVNAALASGKIDAASLSAHTAMGIAAAKIPVKIVMLLDESVAADALIVDGSIKSLADLKGKQIAFEEGTTSDILLHRALDSAGISWHDIVPVPMSAAAAGTALIAKRVSAAVTYEPYLGSAKQQNSTVHTLFSGADDPGIISDVFVVREDVLKERPGQVLALLKSWDEALKNYNDNTVEGRKIIADAVGAAPEELESGFNGVKFYSLEENKSLLTGTFANETFPHIQKSAQGAGLVNGPLKSSDLIDARFVEIVK